MNRTTVLTTLLLVATLSASAPAAASLPADIESYEQVVSASPQAIAHFGSGIALNAETLAVGARLEDDLGTQNVGAAYVFTWDPDSKSWLSSQRIPSPLATIWNEFGASLVLDGDRLAIGGGRRGAVVAILERQADGNWVLVDTLVSPRPSLHESFGRDLALDGSTLVVGAPRTLSEPGSVYVFQLDGDSGDWNLAAELQGSLAEDEDWFGHTVSLHGDRLAVGAPRVDGLSSESGLVYLYERSVAGWSEVEILRPDLPATFDQFGFSVSLAGDRLLVGSPLSHRSHVFERQRGRWGQTAELMDVDSQAADFEGTKVTLAHGGRQAVVTATQAADEAGAAYVFQVTRDGGWVETWRFYGEEKRDQLGLGLDSHGDTLAVGCTCAPGDLHQAGAAYLLKAPLLPEAVVRVPRGKRWPLLPLTSARPLPIVVFSTKAAVGEPLDFDATQIDLSTVRLGPNQVKPPVPAARVLDVDRDGDLDLVIRVPIRELGLECSDRFILVHGKLLSGERFLGRDAIRPVACR